MDANKLTLTLLVGPPGSGKSTVTKIMGSTTIVISSDALRGIIGTGESDQSVSFFVFKTMEHMTGYFLSRGQNVVIDATNYNKKSRKNFIEIARKYGARVVALVSTTSREECKRRNAARERVVPVEVIDRMFDGFEMPLIGEVDEIQTF